jgi:hypothetical protein
MAWISLQSKEETMLKKINLCAALIALVTVASSLAQTNERVNEPPMPPVIATPEMPEMNPAPTAASLKSGATRSRAPETWLLSLWLVRPGGGVTKDTINGFASRGECSDYGARYKQMEHRWQVEYLCETEFQVDARRPGQAMLTEIVSWLAANFDLPEIHDYPQIEFAPPAKLVAMRYKGKLPEAWREDSIRDPAVQAVIHREVVAVYNDATRTIFLPESWSGKTAAEKSILVHEMVHHVQNLAGLRFECPAAREKTAYEAQSEWLKREGLDLEKEFEIDMLTLIVSSACMH